MKKYKLLKNLPTFKAGDKFFISENGNLIAGTPEESFAIAYTKKTLEQFPNILTEWFEEIEYRRWAISTLNSRVEEISNTPYSKWTIENLKSLGLLFSTKQEAEEHLGWLKARATLLKDTKDFKPDWCNFAQPKWYVEYDYEDFDLNIKSELSQSSRVIYFKSYEDAENSIKSHEKEWKIYLGVE